MKLSKTEQRIYDYIKKQGKDVTLTQVVNYMYGSESKINNPRSSVAAMIRNIQIKSIVLHLSPIERISRLGTGSPAIYRMRKIKRLHRENAQKW